MDPYVLDRQPTSRHCPAPVPGPQALGWSPGGFPRMRCHGACTGIWGGPHRLLQVTPGVSALVSVWESWGGPCPWPKWAWGIKGWCWEGLCDPHFPCCCEATWKLPGCRRKRGGVCLDSEPYPSLGRVPVPPVSAPGEPCLEHAHGLWSSTSHPPALPGRIWRPCAW